MQFAFSTIACPESSVEQIAERAKALGYDGVEIDAGRFSRLIGNPVELAAVGELFKGAGVHICCVATGLAYAGSSKADADTADRLRKSIDAAKGIGCKRVGIAGRRVKPGSTRSTVGMAFGNWLLPLGDYAAECGVTVVVENTLSFRLAGEMWFVLDRLDHPSIRCSWNVLSAWAAGESPAVSVPTLNRKIAHVHLDDARLEAGRAIPTALGAGEVPLRIFFTRMRGIGFDGWMTYAPATPSLAAQGLGDLLGGAIKYLREFAIQQPKVPAKGAAKKPPVPAAKPKAAGGV